MVTKATDIFGMQDEPPPVACAAELAFICPEYQEQVKDGVVYLRGSCRRMVCVKWVSGDCRMCAVDVKQPVDLLEGRSR